MYQMPYSVDYVEDEEIEDIIMESTESDSIQCVSPPTSPSKNSELIHVKQHGVLYCKKTNTYVYNKVRFNTLRAAITCRKTHAILGKETSSLGNGIYLYNDNSYNSLEPLRRAQSSDILNHLANNSLDPAVEESV